MQTLQAAEISAAGVINRTYRTTTLHGCYHLSCPLPLSTRRASSLIDTWMSKGKKDNDRVEECGRMGGDVAGVAAVPVGEVENREGEDPWGSEKRTTCRRARGHATVHHTAGGRRNRK